MTAVDICIISRVKADVESFPGFGKEIGIDTEGSHEWTVPSEDIYHSMYR
jgi:hypothetical protein